MHIKVLAALLVFVTTTWAGGNSDELSVAVKQEREASTRVWYHQMQTVIADRDVATARITSETATMQRAIAINEQRNADADRWSKRLAQAQRDEREAQGRADRNRRELDRARSDLHASSAQVRKLEQVATRR